MFSKPLAAEASYESFILLPINIFEISIFNGSNKINTCFLFLKFERRESNRHLCSRRLPQGSHFLFLISTLPVRGLSYLKFCSFTYLAIDTDCSLRTWLRLSRRTAIHGLSVWPELPHSVVTRFQS